MRHGAFGHWGFGISASAALDLFITVPVERREGRLVLVQDESGNLRQGREPLWRRSVQARFSLYRTLLHDLHRNVLA